MNRLTFRHFSFIFGLMLMLISDVVAQDCWKCIGRRDPDTIGCTPDSTGGRTCDIKCSGSECTCRIGEPCRDRFSSSSASGRGCSWSSGPGEAVIADQIQMLNGKFVSVNNRDDDGMKIKLDKASLDRLAPKFGLLALTLKLSAEEHGLLRSEVSEGIYLGKPVKNGVREMYSYTSEIKAKSDSAIANFKLLDHPKIARVVAYINDNGSSGKISFEYKNGAKHSERW
jgi:hypothetical protein